MRIGCCIVGGPFVPPGAEQREYTPLETLVNAYRFIRETGYDYMETPVARILNLSDEEMAQAAELYKRGEFRVEVTNCFIPGSLPLIGEKADHAAIHAYLEKVMPRLEAVGVEYVVFGSGAARRFPDDMPVEQAQAELEAFMTEAEAVARAHNITIVIEPLNRGETNSILSVSAGGEIARRLNLPNLKLLADSYHMELEQEPLTSLVENEDLLRHVHVAEPQRRKIPNREGGAYLRTFGAVLSGTSYQGRVSIECRYEDFVEDLRFAYPFMREVF